METSNKKSAFTLVELLVVIAIMATLMAILLPNFMGARQRATDSRKKQELAAMKTALRQYYNDTQSYPLASDLGTVWAKYMPAAMNIGYTYMYTQVPGGDSFTIKVETEATSAQENAESQVRCGVGVTEANYYYVCAN